MAGTNLNPGDIVVTDLSTESLILVDPDTGSQTLLSSGGILVDPYDVAVDTNGDLLVAQGIPGHGEIVRVNLDTGDQSLLSTGLYHPRGIAIETKETVLVADYAPRVIRVDTETGDQTLVSSGGDFSSVRDIAVDTEGRIFVVIQGAVIRVDPESGEQTLISSGGFLGRGSGIAVEASGDILVADSSTGFVIRIDEQTGSQISLAGQWGVSDVAIEESGNIVVTNPNGSVHRIDPVTGSRTTVSQGGYLGSALRGITVVQFTSEVFTCSGFEAPMGNGTVTAHGNRALPLKARLFDCDGNEITDLDLAAPPVVQVLFDSSQGGDPQDVTGDAYPAGWGTEGNQFEYNVGDGIWQYNLKTKNYTAAGSYTITMVSGDDSEYVIDPTCTAVFLRTN
jgi:sugar lactone lactonase YvrE